MFRLRMYTEIQAPMKHIEEIAHTADWAIRVRAPDVPQLFEAAAEGMFGLLTDLSTIVPEQHHDIRLHAIDVETLLVDWLNELLYLAEQHGLAFTRFTIRELDLSGGSRLLALASGGRPRELNKAIKAATFSGLSIRQDSNGYQVDLVFDV